MWAAHLAGGNCTDCAACQSEVRMLQMLLSRRDNIQLQNQIGTLLSDIKSGFHVWNLEICIAKH